MQQDTVTSTAQLPSSSSDHTTTTTTTTTPLLTPIETLHQTILAIIEMDINDFESLHQTALKLIEMDVDDDESLPDLDVYITNLFGPDFETWFSEDPANGDHYNGYDMGASEAIYAEQRDAENEDILNIREARKMRARKSRACRSDVKHRKVQIARAGAGDKRKWSKRRGGHEAKFRQKERE